MLEERGLLAKIAVDIHPNTDALTGEAADLFDGLGLRVSESIDKAYRAAERFTDLLKKRTRSAGFLKACCYNESVRPGQRCENGRAVVGAFRSTGMMTLKIG